jgi:hypothetical protein
MMLALMAYMRPLAQKKQQAMPVVTQKKAKSGQKKASAIVTANRKTELCKVRGVGRAAKNVRGPHLSCSPPVGRTTRIASTGAAAPSPTRRPS